MKSLGGLAGLALLLAALGLGAAWPFCSSGATYSGDGFNYSLSVADAVTQVRQGQFPPLVGSSRFALNGRVHPLRTAPYLHYLAIGIDELTGHRLALWQLQNASLAFSLVLAAFATYAALRRATGCRWESALLLTATYLYSPSVLGAAYGLDLFMTVHAVPFIPIAVAGALVAARRSTLTAECVQAIGLAGAWWAHPPVALWLTTGVGLLRLFLWLRSPGLRSFLLPVLGGMIFGVLALFPYVSASTLKVAEDGLSLGANDPMADSIIERVHADFPQLVLPINAEAQGEWDLQLSYAGYALILGSLAWVFWRRRGRGLPEEATRRWQAALLAGFGLFLVVLDLPVPGLTYRLWHALPSTYLVLTNSWPMYRLFLVAQGFAIFAGAIALAALPARRLALALCLLAAAWVGWEGHYFIRRGLGSRTSFEVAKRRYLPGNVDLTLTSYAFGVLPPWYVCGAEDGDFMFRLLDPDGASTSNYTSVEAGGRLVYEGRLEPVAGLPRQYEVRRPMVLEPGRRYLASVHFTMPPSEGFVQLIGDHLNRSLPMGGVNGVEGFGMGPRQHVSTAIETDKGSPEEVAARVVLPASGPAVAAGPIGTVTLKQFAPEDETIRVASYVPLRLSVDVPGDGYSLATPRMYMPGYAVTIDGKPVDSFRSRAYQLAFPVPKGTHQVAVDYVGPLSLRVAFWTSAAGWIGVLLWLLVLPLVDLIAWIEARAAAWPWVRIGVGFLAGAVVLVPAGWGFLAWKVRGPAPGAGAALIRVRLPFNRSNVPEPLIAAGVLGSGTQVGVRCVDASHVRLIADAGAFGRFDSKVLPCDYSAEHTVVATFSALYPSRDVHFLALPDYRKEELRQHLAVFWDGVPVIDAPVFAYESNGGQVRWAADGLSSLMRRDFRGTVVETRRLPLPTYAVSAVASATLITSFDDKAIGVPEGLLYACNAQTSVSLTATAEENGWVRLEVRGGKGTVVQAGSFRSVAGASHRIGVRLGAPSDLEGSVAVEVDGSSLIGGAGVETLPMATFFSTDPKQVFPAEGFRPFTGAVLKLDGIRPLAPHALERGQGAVDLVLRFPSNRPPGLHEPLLTTGVTGAGDSVFVVYVDSTHIRLGFDDWGLGGPVSAPIEIDYARTHTLRLLPASLTPGEDLWYADLDGERVLEKRMYAHARAGEFPVVGVNLIGFSTSQPEFSGEIYLAVREAQ